MWQDDQIKSLHQKIIRKPQPYCKHVVYINSLNLLYFYKVDSIIISN